MYSFYYRVYCRRSRSEASDCDPGSTREWRWLTHRPSPPAPHFAPTPNAKLTSTGPDKKLAKQNRSIEANEPQENGYAHEDISEDLRILMHFYAFFKPDTSSLTTLTKRVITEYQTHYWRKRGKKGWRDWRAVMYKKAKAKYGTDPREF